ncbi:unnamed protein product [Paramecium pentaurelia]|uniref:Uncharacterized protein n=1 Tax=Paramecium pentaurelia TaxID=43138 RepID=A0A8S1XMZ1_9CILI|nr:unnamed protein product [Paramecium pentaurelia]
MNQEDDEKFFIQTVQTQQIEIESLKKQIRLQEFQSKQQHLELINSLEQLKKRNEDLDIELNKQIESAHETKLQQFALQMQEQLAKAEEQILLYQENEIRLIKEIQQLQAKLESDKISDLKQQLVKMEETAIALIVEKEFIISEQAKEIELLKQNEKNNNAQTENSSQIQIYDIQELENKIQDYQYKLEHQQQLHEEQLSNLERSITNNIFESLELEMNQKKLVEQDLLHQIGILEEKNKYYEKLINEQEKKLNILRDEKHQEQIIYDKKFQDISERLRYALQQLIKSDKKCEDAYKQFSQLQREKQNMTKQKEELIRKLVYLENQNRKHTQAIQEYKELIETLQQQVNEQDQTIQEQNDQLQKLAIHYEQQLKIAILSHPQKLELNDHEIPSNQNALLSDLLKDSQISQNHENTHIEDPNHSISQTPTSHLSDSYCSFQTKNSSRRRVGPNGKYENIKDALLDAKHTIKIQNLEISNLEQTVEILQKELKSQLLEIHNLRKMKLDFKQEKENKLEIEKLKLCLNTMETHYLTTKLSLAEEINFLKDELKRAESEALKSKLQLTQLNAQFCIMQQKYQKLDKQHQQSFTTRQITNIDEKSPVKGRKSIFSIFG